MNKQQVMELALEYGIDTGDNCVEFAVADMVAFVRAVEQATLERAAGVCRSWRGGKLLLNAGEMTGQELRTVRAVTEAAANEILRLKDSHD